MWLRLRDLHPERSLLRTNAMTGATLKETFWGFFKPCQSTVHLGLSFQSLSESCPNEQKKASREKSARREAVGGRPAADWGAWWMGKAGGVWSCWSPVLAQGFRERIWCLISASESIFISFLDLKL